MQPHALGLLTAPTLMATTLPLQAFDINQQLSVNGFILGAGQCQSVSALLPGGSDGKALYAAAEPLVLDETMVQFDNQCSGGMPFQMAMAVAHAPLPGA